MGYLGVRGERSVGQRDARRARWVEHAAHGSDPDLASIGRRFELPGAYVAGTRHGSGHIHETFVVSYADAGRRARFVHQRLNTHVFADLAALMRNLERVTGHLRAGLEREGARDLERRCLTLVPTPDERSFCTDDEGGVWRTFRFIEGARTHDPPAGPAVAFEAARACAGFVARLADLDPHELAVTIPRFHDLASRFADLQTARRADVAGRAADVGREIDAASLWFERLARELEREGAAGVPRRSVHNDCKLNNVMIDEATGEGVCVIDLDTVMEGSVLFDFGALVRTAACPSPEDEVDLACMRFDLGLFEALARGYLLGGESFLTEPEIRALPSAGSLLALQHVIRFLTDHLSGDVYFRIHREGHNLDRARAQLRLVELMDEASDATRRIVTRAAREARRAAR